MFLLANLLANIKVFSENAPEFVLCMWIARGVLRTDYQKRFLLKYHIILNIFNTFQTLKEFVEKLLLNYYFYSDRKMQCRRNLLAS